MNLKRRVLFVGLSLLLFFKGEAAPRIEVEASGDGKILLNLRGALQVQADVTNFDARTGKMSLKGSVVLTSKDASGRAATLRSSQAVLSSSDAEFQIVDKVLASFDDGSEFVNRARTDGNQELYIEMTLQDALRKHPGFQKYRLRYSGVGAGAGTSGTILFDQINGILKVHKFFSYPEAKMFFLDDRSFSGVTSAILERAFEAAKTKSPTKKFGNLSLFGCKLIDRSRGARN